MARLLAALPSWQSAINSIVLIALYYLATRLGQVLSFGTEAAISPVWPPAGVALAGMLILGVRYAPALVLADLLGTLALADEAPHFVVVLATAVIKALVYSGAAYLLHRYLRFDHALERQRDVLSLVVVAAPLTSVLTATLGVGALWLSGDLGVVDFPAVRWFWWLWLVGDLIGVIVVAPPLLTWSARHRIHLSPRRVVEAVALGALVGLISILVLDGVTPASYAVFPALVWAALRFGPRGAATAVLLVAGLSILFTTHGLGPFVEPTVIESLAALETFTAVVAVTVLILAAVISERQNAEQAIRFQARLLDVVNQGVVAVALDGTITYWNRFAETLYGWSPEETVGRSVLDIRAPSAIETIADDIATHLRSGESWTGELQMPRKDGSAFPAMVSSAPMFDSSGHLSGIVTVSVDLSERKRAEEALRESEDRLRQAQKMEAVGLLAGGIAHDFSNMLTAIIGLSELMSTRLPQDSPVRDLAQRINNAGQRAATLTRQLLIFSRQHPLQPRVINLNTVVNDVVKLLERVIGAHIQVVVVADEGLGAIEIDPGQIEQVLLNLAINARDAMPEGGKLVIETANVELDGTHVSQHLGAPPGRYVLLGVTDTGHGMDAETQGRIFEPFFTTKERGKGTGLGLATVFGIVQQCGGDIFVRSEVGVGTSFQVYLPRVKGAATPQTVPLTNDALPRGTETILVVEDDETVRGLADEVLQSVGYTVLTADGGAQALAMSEQYPGRIDLVLTDVVMPGMIGPQVAARIAEQRPTARTVYMSGFPGEIGLNGGDGFAGASRLSKPFTMLALTRTIRDALDAKAVEAAGVGLSG